MSDRDSPRLFLIDGYALIYRAFFAMISRPLRTSRGENTSAVWGVANFLHRLFEQHHPTHVAWIHDSGTSFRAEVFPDYKATRQKLDDELQEDFDRSVERIEALLAAFRVPLIAVDGYEADDVIGTLAHQAADRQVQAVIVSGDKDFYQLISPHVALLNPGRGGPAAVEEQLVDLSNASDRLGVPPGRVTDYLALVGDSSDNVPGVRGVGDKTARKLIEEYGDLESILAHAAEVAGKRAREALLAEGDNARLSLELVTIRRDVPVQLELERLRAVQPDADALAQLYAELEFHTLIPRLDPQEPATASAPPTEYRLATRAADVRALVAAARSAKIVTLDVQGSHADPMRARPVGLAIATRPGRAWYVPLEHRVPEGELMTDAPPENLPALTDPTMAPLRELLEDARTEKAGHDIKYLAIVLRRAGVAIAGLTYDTMLASFVLDPGRRAHTLDVLAVEHLNRTLTSVTELVGKGKTERPLAEVAPGAASDYACAHADVVLALRERFAPQLHAANAERLLDEIEIPLVEVLAAMEMRGIRVDTDQLAELATQFGAELRELEGEIYREAGTDFNINSNPQLRHVLFEKLQLPVLKKTKTGASTDADVLAELAAMGFALPRLLIEYRELAKLRSTYLDALPHNVNQATGRIHTSFNQTGASTGRLSSSEPNLQNIPVRTRRGELIRRCFVPQREWQFIVADYSQIELRLLAHLSEDPAFIAAFQRGGDIHRETAAIIFDVPLGEVTPDMRARAKTINFATIYGQGPFALSRQLGITQQEAKDFIRLYFERLPGVRAFLDGSVERARRDGFVETLFGRRRFIPELRDKSFNIRAFGERVAMNSPLQGSAADLIKIAMIRLHAALREANLETRMLLQVHDELVLEGPEPETPRARDIVRGIMEGVATLTVPLVVEIGVGPNWLDAKA